MARDFRPYRDEMIISSKAGWGMWPGPYGDLGSRKYLIASCDQSLKRMGLDYVDIFYSHRYDPDTPLEETMGALAQLHRQGKALYVGISSYPREADARGPSHPHGNGRAAADPPAELFDPQPLDRGRQDDRCLRRARASASSPFSPLAQGVLSGKYSARRPRRARGPRRRTRRSAPRRSRRKVLKAVDALGKIAKTRKQTLVQLALSLGAAAQGSDLGADRRAHARPAQGLPRGGRRRRRSARRKIKAINAAAKGGMLDQRPRV